MADEHDPQQPTSAEGSGMRGLEQRVARLEAELAALQLDVAAGWGAQVEARRVAPAPPPPTDASPAAPASASQHPASEAWGRNAPTSRPTAPASESRDSLESRLGSQIFNRIAIVLLLIGTAYFLKLAADRHWVGPTGRVLVGLLAGAGLVVWSERFRHKGFASFSYSLKAVGSGVLYLSLWAAFQRYQLLPASVAFALMLLVTAWNAYMAWAQDSELLAAYALAGGFLTPVLVSTGGNHEIFLFSYLLALDLAIVALVRLKTWPRLLLGAFPLTVVFFIAWYAEYYRTNELTTTSLFIALFAAAFASVPLRSALLGRASPDAAPLRLTTLLEDILLPLANAAFAALAFYSVLQDAGHHAWLPWLMVALAAAYLGLMRAPQTKTASAIHLSLAVVFLTIAIPLKASGAWITASWLVEGLALLWVAARLAGDKDAEGYASSTLRWLASGSLLLGFCGVCAHSMLLNDTVEVPLLNKGTGTALTGLTIFAGAAWLALRTGAGSQGVAEGRKRVWGGMAKYAFVLIVLTAVLLTGRELVLSWGWPTEHLPFQTPDFITALIALAVFAGVIATSMRIASERAGEEFWMNCAATSTIVFNLIAVLTGVREITAVWSSLNADADAALQQALAISGFLMLYGAALLAAGFWKRSGFLRWQALVLLLFTICKVFLYDMRTLSQGYRVASILALGALLLAISFAYQKDLLNLREPAKTREQADPNANPDASPDEIPGAAK